MTQTKSKSRIRDHGEVFTNKREVNAMLNLVEQEVVRIESRFLEPACGSGNFLIEILNRKLDVVTTKYKKSQLDWERYAFVAISSIYGIDILPDNVDDCRENLYNAFVEKYRSVYKKKTQECFFPIIEHVLSQNILLGNALTMKMIGTNQPIIFAEWTLTGGSMVKRKDYVFEELLLSDKNAKNIDLFSLNIQSDTGHPVFIPNSIKIYPKIHFMKVRDNE
jgi:hypothetical protein